MADAILAWLQSLSNSAPWAFWTLFGTQALGGFVVVASAIIKATPGTNDDEWWKKLKEHKVWGKVVSTLESLSLVKRKENT